MKLKTYILVVTCIMIYASCQQSGVQLSNDTDMLKYGQSLYGRHCISCHGDSGDAMLNNATNLTTIKKDVNDIGDVIFHGKNSMPPYKELLGEPEIRAVSLYCKSLQK
ncbi:MAG: cytochrome c [Bacteroidetes bacterium]|nr:cytochrome c [Bacteroidota bacterium]